MPTQYPTEADLRLALQSRASEFGEITGMSPANIGTHAINDAAAIPRIVGGGNFLVETYSRLMDWLDRHWPREGVIATPEEFEVLDTVTPRRVRDLRVSIIYRTRGGGKPRSEERKGECMTPEPRLVVGLPVFAMRDWPYDAEQRFSFARGAMTARILVADAGVPLIPAAHGGARFQFGFVPALGHASHPREWLPFRRLDPMQAGGAVIEIDAPAWLRSVA